jgi:hypothetical protein
MEIHPPKKDPQKWPLYYSHNWNPVREKDFKDIIKLINTIRSLSAFVKLIINGKPLSDILHEYHLQELPQEFDVPIQHYFH